MGVKQPHTAANAESEAEMKDEAAAPNLSAHGAPSSLSDPSTSLVSLDERLRLCRHNHIHLLPQTERTLQSGEKHFHKKSKVKKNVATDFVLYCFIDYDTNFITFHLI